MRKQEQPINFTENKLQGKVSGINKDKVVIYQEDTTILHVNEPNNRQTMKKKLIELQRTWVNPLSELEISTHVYQKCSDHQADNQEGQS